MNPYSVLLRPVLSEKSNIQQEDHGKYTFVIAPKATKYDVKAAVENLFQVRVENVRTLTTRGSHKRRGMYVSLSSKEKKAVVTLAAGQTIKQFKDQ